MVLFDYIVYRIARLYLKWDKSGETTAIIIISLAQTLIVIDLLGTLYMIFIDSNTRSEFKDVFSITCVSILSLFFWFNYKRYIGKYDKFQSLWRNESNYKRILRGILIWIFILSILSSPAILINLLN